MGDCDPAAIVFYPSYPACFDANTRICSRWQACASPRWAQYDRRSHALYLTRAGEALLKHVLVLEAGHEERMTAKIGKAGSEQLLALLYKLSASD